MVHYQCYHLGDLGKETSHIPLYKNEACQQVGGLCTKKEMEQISTVAFECPTRAEMTWEEHLDFLDSFAATS